MSRRTPAAAALVVGVLGVAVLALSPVGPGGDASTAALPSGRSGPQAATAPLSSGPVGALDVVPTGLRIPELGVETRLLGLGLQDDDTVEVPENPDRAGWFDLGTVPGEAGSAVILGHVDSASGPAVFADLATLERGDLVDVTLSDDTVVRFGVRRVVLFANDDFPARRVYAGSTRRHSLNLVTCGGRYDPDRGGYQSNVVVFTQRVAPAGA